MEEINTTSEVNHLVEAPSFNFTPFKFKDNISKLTGTP